MSLRLRLVASIGAALLLSLVLSAGLSVWRAADAVRTELAAALEVGGQTVRAGLLDAAKSGDAAAGLPRLVAAFDGDRHLAAALLDPAGRMVAQSRPLLADPPVPGWFLWLVGPALPAPRFAAADGSAVVLTPEPANEAGEAWAALADTGLLLLTLCGLASALIVWITGLSLRPLARLSDAFGRVGAGDLGVRVTQDGAPELAELAAGFNRMAERLTEMSAQNARLHEQLLTLQDEERAEFARDLHDEIGPFLFSVSVTTATIERLAGQGRVADLPEQLAAIRDSVGHMQKHVRELLTRLRPVSATEFGLAPALANLQAFWCSRRPDVAIQVAMAAELELIDEALAEVIYRVVQESMSNAMRHASPGRIDIRIAACAQRVSVDVSNDGPPAHAPGVSGLGLAGMGERVSAAGGSLVAGPAGEGGGWTVQADLPMRRLPAACGRAA